MDRKELLLALVLAFCMAVLFYAIATAADQTTLDHAFCQYPSRESNPPESCDNTDPAIPETVIKPVKDEVTPAPTVNAPPAASSEAVEAFEPLATGK